MKNPDAAWDYLEGLAGNMQSWDYSDPPERNVVNPVLSSSGKFNFSEQNDLSLKVAQLTRKLETMEPNKIAEVAFVAKAEEMCSL